MAETDRQQATSCLPAANAGATKKISQSNGADKYYYAHVLATDYVSKSLSYRQNDCYIKLPNQCCRHTKSHTSQKEEEKTIKQSIPVTLRRDPNRWNRNHVVTCRATKARGCNRSGAR